MRFVCTPLHILQQRAPKRRAAGGGKDLNLSQHCPVALRFCRIFFRYAPCYKKCKKIALDFLHLTRTLSLCFTFKKKRSKDT